MVTTPDVDVKIFNAIKGAKPLVTVCGWCPDAKERTRAEVALGHDVTHGMCPSCTKKFEAGQ